ncbi:MAG: helix-turn-helix domain-containing protein [Actinomycetota bacterium]
MPTDDHDIRFLTWPGIQPLDLVGPYEVFAGANRTADALGRGGPRYRLRVLALDATTITAESGLQLVTEPTGPGVDGDDDRFDTLILPGGDGSRDAANDPAVVAEVAALASRADRLATVCTGTFLAAAAGIVDGCRVATHWAWAQTLAQWYPDVHVDAEAMHVCDALPDGRPVWSSAGVTAGIDLALAMVEHDHDPEVAQTVGRWLVVHLRRPGSQSQYAAPMWADPSPVPPIRQAQGLIQAAPADDHGLENLARRVGLSSRHLSRLFQAETGETPGRYVERVRVDLARQELETGNTDLGAVARLVGFGSSETLRRAFHRRLGVSPDDYRRRFRLEPSR